MREWLSGGVSPCQGEGRGFESRLALFFISRNFLVLQGISGFRVFGNLYTAVDRHFYRPEPVI